MSIAQHSYEDKSQYNHVQVLQLSPSYYRRFNPFRKIEIYFYKEKCYDSFVHCFIIFFPFSSNNSFWQFLSHQNNILDV